MKQKGEAGEQEWQEESTTIEKTSGPFIRGLVKEVGLASLILLFLIGLFTEASLSMDGIVLWFVSILTIGSSYFVIMKVWFRTNPSSATRNRSKSLAAILSILGLILMIVLIPQFLEYQYRRVVYKSLDRLEEVKKALANYHLDWGELPSPFCVDRKGFIPPVLTSPIKYVKDIPEDPFQHAAENHPRYGNVFHYWVAPATHEEGGIKVMVISFAPDGIRDLPIDSELNSLPKVSREYLYEFQYHPSNGSKSFGDFILWSGNGVSPGNVDQADGFWSSH